jgi:hypothetical protein
VLDRPGPERQGLFVYLSGIYTAFSFHGNGFGVTRGHETVNQPGMNPPAVPMSFIYQKKWESIKAISIANILRIGKSYIYSSAQSDWADDFTMTARHYSPPHSESRISRQRRRMARYYIGRRVLLKQFLSWQVVKYKSAIEKKEKERWACPFFYKAPVQLADLFFFLSYL